MEKIIEKLDTSLNSFKSELNSFKWLIGFIIGIVIPLIVLLLKK